MKKGLCSCCVNDKDCTFPRKFPVIQCEEFTGSESGKQKQVKRKKVKSDEEPVV